MLIVGTYFSYADFLNLCLSLCSFEKFEISVYLSVDHRLVFSSSCFLVFIKMRHRLVFSSSCLYRHEAT